MEWDSNHVDRNLAARRTRCYRSTPSTAGASTGPRSPFASPDGTDGSASKGRTMVSNAPHLRPPPAVCSSTQFVRIGMPTIRFSEPLPMTVEEAALQLDSDIGPGLLGPGFQGDKTIVTGGQPQDDNRENQ